LGLEKLNMKNMLQPTGAMLVGLAFLLSCLCSSTGAADPANANYPDSLNKVKEFHAQFTSPSYFASDQGRSKLPFLAKSSRFADDKIFMKGPSQSLEGLISVNGVKRRSASYDGLLQSTNYKMNAMDIAVSGITVIAINMVEGGNAVATSDIVLRPVQILGCSAANAEVDEKLK
jgi:hypothetical protein